MEIDKLRALITARNSLRFRVDLKPQDVFLYEQQLDSLIAALEQQREIKCCIDNANNTPEPSEHIEGDTCEQYCGDCPHRICGRQRDPEPCEYCKPEPGVHKAQGIDCWRIDGVNEKKHGTHEPNRSRGS